MKYSGWQFSCSFLPGHRICPEAHFQRPQIDEAVAHFATIEVLVVAFACLIVVTQDVYAGRDQRAILLEIVCAARQRFQDAQHGEVFTRSRDIE